MLELLNEGVIGDCERRLEDEIVELDELNAGMCQTSVKMFESVKKAVESVIGTRMLSVMMIRRSCFY